MQNASQPGAGEGESHPLANPRTPNLQHNGDMTFAPDSDEQPAPFRVCFVCTGNICRSPMAEIVFRDIVTRAGLRGRVQVSSAGTGDWHVGEKADARTIAALARRGYDGEHHRARQFETEWFENLDLVVVLDRSHERVLRTWAPSDVDRSKVQLLLSFGPMLAGQTDVPDPYYSDAAMFDSVLATIETASHSLFAQLEPALRHAPLRASEPRASEPQSAPPPTKGIAS